MQPTWLMVTLVQWIYELTQWWLESGRSSIDTNAAHLVYDDTILCGSSQIARFMGPTWGPSGADRTQVGPMLAPWTLLSGHVLTQCLVPWILAFVHWHCQLAVNCCPGKGLTGLEETVLVPLLSRHLVGKWIHAIYILKVEYLNLYLIGKIWTSPMSTERLCTPQTMGIFKRSLREITHNCTKYWCW